MLEELGNKALETIATNPIASAPVTYALVEAIKKVKPDLVKDSEVNASLILPMVAAGILKAAGVVGFATVGWVPLLASALIGGFFSKPVHDSMACRKEQSIEKATKLAAKAKKDGD